MGHLDPRESGHDDADDTDAGPVDEPDLMEPLAPALPPPPDAALASASRIIQVELIRAKPLSNGKLFSSEFSAHRMPQTLSGSL